MLTAKPRIYIDIVNSDIGVTVTRNGGFKCELQKKWMHTVYSMRI